MAASKGALVRRWQAAVGGVLALFGAGAAKAVTLPADRAEGMYHIYNGGGMTAHGPAFLVRKSVMDKVSLSGSVYVDAVSNASVDVVTTASKYKERRTEWGFGADYAVRDALLSFGLTTSKEPDYKADAFSLDVSQETFGGQTTVALGFTRAADKVGQAGIGFFDEATHWQYRLGVTQILSPKWIASANLEAIADSGYLGNPYRAARVFGAAVPERVPRTRSSRALNLRSIYDMGSRDAIRGSYRYFWDNWAVKAHTVEGGYSRYVGESFLLDGYLRLYKQTAASFYADNAQADTLYVTRNRQLGDYSGATLGGKATFTWKKVPGQYEIKANLAVELLRYRYANYTDLRTGNPYTLNAGVVQLYVTANY